MKQDRQLCLLSFTPRSQSFVFCSGQSGMELVGFLMHTKGNVATDVGGGTGKTEYWKRKWRVCKGTR